MAPEPSKTLTRPERRVLMYLAAGCTMEGVARIVGRSPHTIKAQADAVRRKLGARSQAHMVAIAYEMKLLEPGTLRRMQAVLEAA
jgi:DNA-binding CsgD family transcriptional regulator